MKKFMERYSYESVHLILNQVAIGLLGITLALAAGMAESPVLRVITGVFAVCFFLMLQYSVMWKIGANDRLSDDLGKHQVDYSVPFKMWILANSLNILLAIFIALGNLFPDAAALSSIGGVAAAIKLVIEGMYTGLLAINVGGAPLNSFWFTHFVTPVPALVICYVGYTLGSKNFKLLGGKNK